MSDLNILPRDQNHVTTAGFANSLDLTDVRPGQIIVATGRIKVDGSGGSGGTVTEVDTGTGLTGGPITTTGTISLDTKLAPMDSLTGNSLKVLRVNVGETAVEYVTLSATPGGLNTQLQYNNAGSLGGITGATSDGTSVSLSGAHLLNPTINGAGAGLATLAYPNTASNATITFPTATGTLATLAGSETLTNKSVNGVTLTAAGSSTSFLNAAGGYTTPAGTGVSSVTGTTNRITSSGGTTPAIDISASYVGQTSITTLGTLTTGATGAGFTIALTTSTVTGLLVGANGGTGVANTGKTITLGGNLTTSGAFQVTLTLTASTTVTLPTSGTIYGTQSGSITSSQFATSMTDETGTGVVVFNAKPTFVGTIQTIAALGALAVDGSTGSYFTKTIATGSTLTQSNFSTGQMWAIKITGAFTVTWFSGITWITTGAAAPTQAAVTTYGFVCTGSNTFDGYLVGTQ